MARLTLWANSAPSRRVDGDMAHYVGKGCDAIFAVLTAREEADGGITVEASRMDRYDSWISRRARLELVEKRSERSPDYRGQIDVPEQGAFNVIAWRRAKENGEPFLSCIVEAVRPVATGAP